MTPYGFMQAFADQDVRRLTLAVAGSTCVDHSSIGYLAMMVGIR